MQAGALRRHPAQSPRRGLIPFRTHDAGKIRAVIDDLKAFQKTHVLGGLSVGSPFSVFAIDPARLCDAVRATVMDLKAG